MTTPITYAAHCLGTGHTKCDWTHDGPGSDSAAERHTRDTKHGTSTHLSGGPYEKARRA